MIIFSSVRRNVQRHDNGASSLFTGTISCPRVVTITSVTGTLASPRVCYNCLSPYVHTALALSASLLPGSVWLLLRLVRISRLA